ncbi:MAG: hypothetical protein AB7O73_07845 [Bacteroidia bacterium]
MKSILLLLTLSLSAFQLNAGNSFNYISEINTELPPKTICIKHALAGDADKLFSTETKLTFEIYKAGNSEELEKMIASFEANDNVDEVIKGSLNGDYQQIQIAFNDKVSKKIVVQMFKDAGLTYIKLNNSAVKNLGDL